jgi:hypothetical protein
MRGGCIDPRFLDLGTSWRWVVSFTLWPLYPLVPIGKEVGWTPELVRTTRRIENSWPYRDSELRTLRRPARSQSLYRLRYSGSSVTGIALPFYCVQSITYIDNIYAGLFRCVFLLWWDSNIPTVTRTESWSSVWRNRCGITKQQHLVLLVPRNFSSGRGAIPPLAEWEEQSCQRGYYQFGM